MVQQPNDFYTQSVLGSLKAYELGVPAPMSAYRSAIAFLHPKQWLADPIRDTIDKQFELPSGWHHPHDPDIAPPRWLNRRRALTIGAIVSVVLLLLALTLVYGYK